MINVFIKTDADFFMFLNKIFAKTFIMNMGVIKVFIVLFCMFLTIKFLMIFDMLIINYQNKVMEHKFLKIKNFKINKLNKYSI